MRSWLNKYFKKWQQRSRVSLIVVGLFIGFPVYAMDIAQVYNQASLLGKQLNSSAADSAKHTNPNDVPGFESDHPSQTDYSASSLEDLANQQKNHSVEGKLIEKSYSTKSQNEIDKNNVLILKANEINKNADQTLQASDAYCRVGDCSDTSYPFSTDFNSAISNLTAGAAASKDFDGNQIFIGQKQTCRKLGMGFSDCCKEKGWGQDVSLATCTAGEKALAMAKASGLCHATGKYCSKQVIGVCREWKLSYCCFHSKLARIIQEQGRGQLHIEWATAKNPSCRGLTPNELQHIQFSSIDFTDYYQDIQNQEHLPNVDETQQHITNEIQTVLPEGH